MSEPGANAEPVDTTPAQPAAPVVPEDATLLGAHDQAVAALAEVADRADIGAPVGGEMVEPNVATLYFECRLRGYPGWRWAASLTRVDESSPITVLEVELLPGDGAVVAPEWVPWSERMAQFRDAQSQDAADDTAEDDADDADAEFDDAGDDDDFDDDDDIDGVDVDAVDTGEAVTDDD